MKNNYLNLSNALLLLAAFAWTFSTTFAQVQQGAGKVQVQGQVVDAEDDSGIPGVNVLEKGTSNGTITDFDGNYSLNVSPNATLIFSYVGYTAQEVPVQERGVVDVRLAPDIQALSEVVVVGYGTQEKKEITSAVASVTEAEFNKGAVNNPTQLLQGKAAGLTISKPGGDPNGDFNVRLRGLSTIGAQAEPLIVIDGVIGGSLNSVDPTDIKSIDILKDGSAAAIYGTRGSSGVILITTKKGVAGKMQVDYNTFGTIETSNQGNREVLSAEEYRAFGQEIAAQGVNIPDRGADGTDWVETIDRPGFQQTHNLSLSGGTESTTYRASFNFRDVTGTLKGSGFTSLNARLNLTQRALNDNATFNAQITTTTKNSDIGITRAWRDAVRGNPTTPIFAPNNEDQTPEDNDGFWESTSLDEFNPIATVSQNVQERKNQTLLMNIKGEYDFSDIVEGFRVGAFYSQQRENQLDGKFFGKNAKFNGRDRNGLAERQEQLFFNQLVEATVNYDRTFGDINLAVLAGYSFQEFEEERFGARGGDFLTDAFSFNALENAQDFNFGTGEVAGFILPVGTSLADLDGSPAPQGRETNTLVAGFGRVNLNYDGTYFLSVSARREGSSRFGRDERWGWFPAASVGVTISNLVEIPSVDNLKLRGSFGITGNQPAFNNLSQPLVGPTGNSFFVDGAFTPSFGPASNPNPDLKWERKTEFDIGLDFSLIEGRLNGSLDWYTRTTDDLILLVDVPVPPNLFPTTWDNVAEIENNGFELQVSYLAIDAGDFTWTPAVNFSTFNTELSDFPNDVQRLSNAGAPGLNGTFLVLAQVGEEIGNLYGPIVTGIDEAGEWVVADLDGDGDTSAGDETGDNGSTNFGNHGVMGNGLPDGEYGINNSFTYGNWDLNFFFRGAFGHDLLNMFDVFHGVPNAAGQFNVSEKAVELFNRGLNANTTADVTSEFVESGDFIRFDNFTLGYNVNVPDDGAVRRLRFYFSGNNLVTFTDYSGVTPEVRFADEGEQFGNGSPSRQVRPDPLVPGIARRSTFINTRAWTIGAQIGL